MSDFKIQNEWPVFRGSAFDVNRLSVKPPEVGSMPYVRDVVRSKGSVSIVAITDNRRVILIRQYRAAVNQHMLELPAGKRDKKDEEPVDCAKRELLEETGFSAANWTELVSYYSSPGFTDERHTIFVATDLTYSQPDLQGPEEQNASLVFLPMEEIAEAIEKGRVEDSKTLIGLTMGFLTKVPTA